MGRKIVGIFLLGKKKIARRSSASAMPDGKLKRLFPEYPISTTTDDSKKENSHARKEPRSDAHIKGKQQVLHFPDREAITIVDHLRIISIAPHLRISFEFVNK